MKQFTVRMRCIVIKEVICEAEYESQLLENPWNFAIDEVETDQHDWDILSIEEDK